MEKNKVQKSSFALLHLTFPMRLKKEETIQKQHTINQNEFRVVGMSRSGNHSIINWIIKQLQGRYCFLNCAEPKTNPFYTARPIESEDLEKTYKVNYQDFDLAAEQRGDFSQKDCLIYSYEDCFLGMLKKKAFEKQHDVFVGSSKRRIDILIIRDPFNLFASRKRSGLFSDKYELSSKPVTSATAKRIWKQHAREASGEKSYLRQNRMVINFNYWVSNPEYRKKIVQALGLKLIDNSLGEVSQVAGGSSFDGLRYINSADKMEVLDRWKHYAHDPDFQNFFDEELIHFSLKIFGNIPDERILPLRVGSTS